MVDHPPLQLGSCHPIWEDTSSVDIISQWEEDWLSASVVNQHLVCDPAIWQPDFDLPHQTRPVFTQAKAHAMLVCTNGSLSHQTSVTAVCHQQTMNHIVDMGLLMKFDCRLTRLVMMQPTSLS